MLPKIKPRQKKTGRLFNRTISRHSQSQSAWLDHLRTLPRQIVPRLIILRLDRSTEEIN